MINKNWMYWEIVVEFFFIICLSLLIRFWYIVLIKLLCLIIDFVSFMLEFIYEFNVFFNIEWVILVILGMLIKGFI